ncbi:MAG: DUF882 domain-containing protein [Ilumatobacter sp.]|nr:DUF882 domain-containing protein [Ilumatobacter sp.]
MNIKTNPSAREVFDVEYAHWSQFPMEYWRWENFSPRELACRGTGKLMVNADAMDKLQAMRTMIGSPLMLNSAYRSKEHNTAVGGAKSSLHMKARAFDISIIGHNPARLDYMGHAAGFGGFGYYRRNNFIHFDTGGARTWGTKWFNQFDPATEDMDAELAHESKQLPEKWTEDPVIRGTATALSGGALSNTADAFGALTPFAQILGILLLGGGVVYLLVKRPWLD